MFALDEGRVAAVLLLWVRLSLLWAVGPLANAIKAPPIFWVLFTLALAASLAGAWDLRLMQSMALPALVLAMLREALLGALLGLALQAAMASFAMAGRLLDVQMGLGMGSVLDPITRANVPVIGALLSLAAMAGFLLLDGHHALLRGLAFSVQQLPPGSSWALPSAQQLLAPVGAMFSVAVLIAAPVLLALLLTDALLAVCSRAMPQMNVLMLGFPVKILIGWFALALSLPALGPLMRRAFSMVFQFWGGVLS